MLLVHPEDSASAIFQKGTVNIVFESSSSSTSGSAAATCCGTATCTSNTGNDLGQTPKTATETIRRKSGEQIAQK